jgi:hypothetical protein
MLLAACGGGGGGGGSSGPDLSTAPGLAVSPASLSFAAVHNGAIPPAQSIQITLSRGDIAFVVVSYLATPTLPTWLTQSPSLTCSGPNCTLTGGPITTSIATGTYTTTIRIAIQDAGRNVLAFRDVPVSYMIQPLAGLAANPTSLSFSQLQGAAAPASQTLGISEVGGASYPWSASIVYQSGSGWLNVNNAASASGATLPTSLSISVNSSATLGTLNALVRVTGNGNTLDVPVSFTVSEPTLTRSPASLTFTAANQGATPAAQNVSLSTQGSLPLNYTTSVTYGPGPTGWLTVPASGTAPGTVAVGVNTTNLAQGTYTATLFVNSAAQSISVGITYFVAFPSLTFSPAASAIFTITTASLPAALSQSIGVGSTGAAISWMAASSQPWVTVSPTSGSSGTSVTVSLDAAQLDTLDPGARSATITFSYTVPAGGPSSTPLSVSLNLQIPKVTSVNPYVATSSTSLEVALRGLGFNNTGGAAVKFGSSTVPSYAVVSDTELQVTHPSLAASSYRVSIANQLGNSNIVRSTGDLVVVDAPVYAATTLTYPDATLTPLNIIYDAERQALLMGVGLPIPGAANGRIYRYTFSSGAWSATPATTAVAKFRDLALSMDGKTLIAATDTSVKQFDAVTLTAGISTSVTLLVSDFLNKLALTNDGIGILTTDLNGSGFTEAYSYSIRDGVFTQFPFVNNRFSRATCGGSADGSRVLVVQGGVSPDQPVYQYSASTGILSQTGLASGANSPRPALDRRATRLVLGGASVYDSNLQKLGNIPAAFTVALSPNGTRAYTSTGTVLNVYDLTGALANPNTDVFPAIGGGTTLPSDPGLGRIMTVSPDGGTLFIAGDAGIVVVPAP